VDAINDFVENFQRTGFDDIPSAARESVKKELLDSLAAALGGSTRQGIQELVDLTGEWGGKEQSTIINFGRKCPAPDAALVNGTMIHALDYDDGHPVAQVHIGCVAVATCFAIAERQGGIDGSEFITTLALGEDFLARLGLASRPNASLIKSGWHPTPLCGYLGAAAMAARLMKLDSKKMLNALGIAYHQCAGNSQAVNDGALTKRLGPGLASRGGITSALMAERGITGARDVLEGEFGFFKQYHDGDYSRQILVADLGKRFEGMNLGFKPYPNCGFSHAYIDAVLNLRKKYQILPDKVQEIIAFCGDQAYSICNPLEIKREPRNPVDAQFSLPWAIAVALVNGKVTVDDFTENAIQKENILTISRKVTGILEPSLSRHGVGPAKITVILKNGESYTEEVEHCLGSVERPMTFEDCAAKFRECAALSRKKLSADTIERVIDMINHLEKLKDAISIIRLLG